MSDILNVHPTQRSLTSLGKRKREDQPVTRPNKRLKVDADDDRVVHELRSGKLYVSPSTQSRPKPAPSPPSAASKVMGIPELAQQVALHLDDAALLQALCTNRTLGAFTHDALFWRAKLSQQGWLQAGDAQETPDALRSRYRRLMGVVRSVETGRMPYVEGASLREHTLDKVVTGLQGMALLVRNNSETGTAEIHDFLENGVSHAEQPGFFPEAIFADGTLCMGWEEGNQLTVRRVSDWSRTAVLETDQDDGAFSFHSVRSWKTAGGVSGDLLHVDRSIGRVEIYDSTGQTLRATVSHPGATDFTVVEQMALLVTVDTQIGDVKIWNLVDASCCAEFNVPNVHYFSGAHGDVLKFVTVDGEKWGHVLCKPNGHPLPLKLQQALAVPSDYWVNFSDGTHVIGESAPIGHTGLRRCDFKIIAHDGQLLGAFEHISVNEIVTFMDRYVVTASFRGDMKVWTKTGVEKISVTQDGYSYPTIIDQTDGKLIVLSSFEGSLDHGTVLDFAASRPRS